MHTTTMKNLHVPLPAPLYRELRAEAERERRRQLVCEALQKYTKKMAGTSADLDPELEAADIENLLANVGRGGKAT